MGTIKKLTDIRRAFVVDLGEQLTGVGRISTVSPWMRERERAKQVENLAKQLGVSSFKLTNVRQADVEAAVDPETKTILEAIRRYQTELRRKQRIRRRAE